MIISRESPWVLHGTNERKLLSQPEASVGSGEAGEGEVKKRQDIGYDKVMKTLPPLKSCFLKHIKRVGL